jgi:hypothetical protein
VFGHLPPVLTHTPDEQRPARIASEPKACQGFCSHGLIDVIDDSFAQVARLHTRVGSASQQAGSLLAESEDGREGFVDAPLLVWADFAHQIAKPASVDCADLLN